MPLTNAEKQKRYRERMRLLNPEKYDDAKKKNAERNKQRKKIKDYDEKGKEDERKKWRVRKNNQKNKNLLTEKNEVLVEKNNTEPNSDTENLETIIKRAKFAERRKMQRQWANAKANYQDEIKTLKKKVKSLQKKVRRYQNKLVNLLHTIDEIKKQTDTSLHETENLEVNNVTQNLTPKSKTNCYIEENLPDIPASVKDKVKKQILSHNILVESLQNSYKNAKTDEERNILKSVANNDIIRKYKSKTQIARFLGLKGKIRWTLDRKSEKRKNKRIIDEITYFFERDDVSTSTAGKKETKTFKKNKKQIRYLQNTLTELYKKYKSEGGTAKISTFKKYRPFYVRRPKITNRDTCACQKHENVLLKCSKLKSLGLIQTKNIEEILSEYVCDINDKNCAYGDCDVCKYKRIKFHWEEIDPDQIISWEEWQTEEHEFKDKTDKSKIKTTKKIVKSQKNGTVHELIEKFNEEIKKIKKHIHNIKHQYRQYSACLKNLSDTEVAMIIDFSENWVCKLSTEIQSMHFGASKVQITIHTGVLYIKNLSPKPFATLSPSNEHGPEAIWAHLEPILTYIKNEHHNVTTIHFFSDSPSTQYRQKKNFYLFAKTTKEQGFPHSTWNYSESSHGKGAADGVGAAIKRKLDNFVSHGIDIPNALVAYHNLRESETPVMIHYISEAKISNFKLPADLKPVPRTMEVHQVINTSFENVISSRCLSCFCTRPVNCKCFGLKTHCLLPNTIINITESIEGNFSAQLDSNTQITNLKRKRESFAKKELRAKTVKKRKNNDSTSSGSSDSEEDVVEYMETDNDMSEFSENSILETDSRDSPTYLLDENTGILMDRKTLGSKKLIKDSTQDENVANTSSQSKVQILEVENITQGKFVLVRFQTNKTMKYYVGQILEVYGINIKVKFTRKKHNDLFYWPQAEDIYVVRSLDVAKVLKDPISTRRGFMQFEVNLNDYKV